MKDMIKSAITLTIVCLGAALLLAVVNDATSEKIEEQKQAALKQNLQEVLPLADKFVEKSNYYEAYTGGELTGLAAVGESYGYSSMLRVLVGVNLNGEITGVRIIDSAETPGLGENAKKPEWYGQFTGLVGEDVKLTKNGGKIDSITGSTITSDAVIRAVKSALEEKLGEQDGN